MPDGALSSVPRFSRGQSLLVAAGAILLVVYPLASTWVVERFGVRAAAIALAAIVAPAFAFAGQRVAAAFGTRAPASIGPLLVTLAAAVTGDRLFLRLVPAAVYLVLFELFRASLHGPMSMIEIGARFMEPYAPEFISSYCRKLTRMWCGFFVVNAIVIAVLAIFSPHSWWRAYTGWIIYAVLAVLSVIEFLVRKWWFRYYFYGTPFDRVWSTWFPADATPEGRRSAAYIERTREELRRQGLSR